MRFNFPPGFDQLPPEIQENIKKGMVRQCVVNMHLGGEFLEAINKMVVSINKIVTDPKYKDDPNISNLDKEIKETLDIVKEEMERFSSEED